MGYPWFDHYREDLDSLKGTKKLKGIKSILELQSINTIPLIAAAPARIRGMNQAQQALTGIYRVTGHAYPELDKILASQTNNSALIQELHRLVRDLEGCIRTARRQGASQPWKCGGF